MHVPFFLRIFAAIGYNLFLQKQMIRPVLISTSVLIVLFAYGCKSSTSPSSSSTNASGTLVVEISDNVVTATLGSNATTTRFQGQDPSWTSDGRVVFDIRGELTADDHEHLNVANVDGTNAATVVNMETSIGFVSARPKMSRDGKYLSFNYSDFLNSKLGTHYGTLIYSATTGQELFYIDSVWDASWSSNGSFAVAGTVDETTEYSHPGLFLIDKNISTITPVGSGLTDPKLPEISPSGKRIAFAMGNHIWTINTDGSGLQQLTTGGNVETFSAWSPDGNSIACETTGSYGTFIAIVSANASAPITVSDENSSLYLKDNANYTGYVLPTGPVDWR